VEVSKEAADGEVSGLPDIAESVGKILQEMDVASGDLLRPGSSLSGYSGFYTHIRRGKASSVISAESDGTIGPDNASTSHPPPTPPPKDEQTPSMQPNSTNPSFTTTLAGGITSAVRYMLKSGDVPRSTSPFSKKHHLLTVDHVHIDDRPHIKYDWTIGKRLKFSCTAYYAKQFDTLRRRCGIDDIFLKSLGRSTNWAAQGGKSKSNFWKTSDERFIIKTLVNAWNVADL
jgi:1-phosphatidylinositol-3-phosphate 5-kinase